MCRMVDDLIGKDRGFLHQSEDLLIPSSVDELTDPLSTVVTAGCQLVAIHEAFPELIEILELDNAGGLTAGSTYPFVFNLYGHYFRFLLYL